MIERSLPAVFLALSFAFLIWKQDDVAAVIVGISAATFIAWMALTAFFEHKDSTDLDVIRKDIVDLVESQLDQKKNIETIKAALALKQLR